MKLGDKRGRRFGKIHSTFILPVEPYTDFNDPSAN